jgi:hypothetical protein
MGDEVLVIIGLELVSPYLLRYDRPHFFEPRTEDYENI